MPAICQRLQKTKKSSSVRVIVICSIRDSYKGVDNHAFTPDESTNCTRLSIPSEAREEFRNFV